MPGRFRSTVATREFWVLAGALLIVVALWDSPLVLPLKWLTVLFHEVSHALAGWLTGGRVVSLNITHRESGICHVAGGNRTLILMAGYPGSLCWGLGALLLARRPRWVKAGLFTAGGALLLVTLFYVRPILGFGFLFSLATAVMMLVWAWYGQLSWQALSLRFLGLGSCVYVLHDILHDVFLHGTGLSDATLLAGHTGVPAMLWGCLWFAIAALLILRSLLHPAGRLGKA